MEYYPIVVKVDDRRFLIEDVRAWANGNFDSIAGLERQILTVMAQSALAWVEKWEKEHKDDLVAAFDAATVVGLHLEYRDLREPQNEGSGK